VANNKLTNDPPSRYKCSVCRRPTPRDRLTVKRALFLGFGRNSKSLRSRVVAWLCDECREVDEDWTRPTTKGGAPLPPGEMTASGA
jgi:hypothetical protein